MNQCQSVDVGKVAPGGATSGVGHGHSAKRAYGIECIGQGDASESSSNHLASGASAKHLRGHRTAHEEHLRHPRIDPHHPRQVDNGRTQQRMKEHDTTNRYRPQQVEERVSLAGQRLRAGLIVSNHRQAVLSSAECCVGHLWRCAGDCALVRR